MRKILLAGIALALMALPSATLADESMERSLRAAGFYGDTTTAPQTSAEEIARWGEMFRGAHAISIAFFPTGHQTAVERTMWAAGFYGDTRLLKTTPPEEMAMWQERFDASHGEPEAFFRIGRERLD